jgi:Ca2+-binding RTX toxin-like protein
MGVSISLGAGADSFVGTGFDDTVFGNAGADTLRGASGNDSLVGGSDNDLLEGDDDNDTLIGQAGGDTLRGGNGNDYLVIDGDVGEVLDGGAGDDTIGFAQYAHERIANLVGIEAVRTNGYYLQGTANANLLDLRGLSVSDGTGLYVEGLGGADTLIGTVENDDLRGGDDNDVLEGDVGNDNLYGGAQADLLDGGIGGDTLRGDAGGDTLRGGEGIDYLITDGDAGEVFDGGIGEDFLYLVQYAHERIAGLVSVEAVQTNGYYVQGTANGNLFDFRGLTVSDALGLRIDGLGGADTLIGTVENDSLNGGDGNDRLEGDVGDDSMDGGADEDFLAGATGNDRLDGGSGNDLLEGGVGNDTLRGQGGADTARGGDDNDYLVTDGDIGDVLDGGAGDDTLGLEAYTYERIGGLVSIEALRLNGYYIQGTTSGNLLDVRGLSVTDAVGVNIDGLGGADTIIGTIEADDLDGGTGDDRLEGDIGDDSLLGGSDNDRLEGGSGADTLRGDAGADTLLGGADNDHLITDGEIGEVLDGGGGEDFLYLVQYTHERIANLVGIEAVRTAGYFVQGTLNGNLFDFTGLFVSDATGLRIDGLGGADTLIGTIEDDSLNGGTENDRLEGALGNDTLAGGSGDDLLDAGAGNDTLRGEAGADTLLGGAGNDIMFVDGEIGDVLNGGADQDTMVLIQYLHERIASVGVEILQSGGYFVQGSANGNLFDFRGMVVSDATGLRIDGLAGADTLIGTVENDTLNGGTEADFLDGDAGADTLTGGDGADTLVGGAGDNRLDGGTGDDLAVQDRTGEVVGAVVGLAGESTQVNAWISIEQLHYTGGSGADMVTGGGLADTLSGGGGNDTLEGGAGNDVLTGGADADSMAGGIGDDLYIVADATDVATENGGGGADTVAASVNWTLGLDFEVLQLTGSATTGIGNNLANRLLGNGLNNTLSGGSGNDTLRGEAGDDSLNGGGNADSMAGGAGNDTYIVDDLGDVVTEMLSGGDDGGLDQVRSTVSFTLGAFIETLTLLGTGAINGTGNTLANSITGNGLANTLSGAEGADTLDGGLGPDTLLGGGGNDVLIVNEVGDVVTENPNAGIDLVLSAVAFTLGLNIENLTLTGNGAVAGTGNNLANVINGNQGANTLSGGNSDDTLVGGGGSDALTGGAGADSLVGGIGNERYTVDSTGDVILELLNEGNDSVVSSVSWTLGDNLESLQLTGTAGLTGIGNDLVNRITGNSGGNLLQGMGGNDVLFGLDGADTLQGGAGADQLTGGTGADSFFFAALADGVDRIVDFVSGTDFIVATTAFGGGLAAGALDPARFVSHASASATSAFGVGQFVYHSGLGALYYDADGGGGAAAERFATLSGAPALAETDFVIA